MGHIDARLAELGITLPAVATPVAAYVAAMTSGNLLFTAGQLPFVDGTLLATGKVGAEVSASTAAELARVCALNALAAEACCTRWLSIAGCMPNAFPASSLARYSTHQEMAASDSGCIGYLRIKCCSDSHASS